MQLDEPGESLHEVMPQLSVYESTQTRIVNLNELIRIHRIKQKYQIWDKFYNDSYLLIDNKVLPIEAYASPDKFKPYIEDLQLIYFKDIEFNQNVRLEHIIRRLNFTLLGEHYDFILFLEENKVYDLLTKIYSQEYLSDLENSANTKKVVNLRNSLFLGFLIHQFYTYEYTNEQARAIMDELRGLYEELRRKMEHSAELQQSEEVFSQHRYLSAVNSITNQSEKSHERFEEEENESNLIKYLKENIDPNGTPKLPEFYSDNVNMFFDDLIYEEEIQLKIIEIRLQNFYFKNQIEDPLINQEHKFRLEYLFEINNEYIHRLEQLKNLNSQNRLILKKIQQNIALEFSLGSKCIIAENTHSLPECFGQFRLFDSVQTQRQCMVEKAKDAEIIQYITRNILNKLRLRQIADSIEKIFEIQRCDSRVPKHSGKLMFSLCFEKGLGVSEAVIFQNDFLMLNSLREQSSLTSYLTPMKSKFSYISHNIFAFLNIYESQKEFPYDKDANNNQQILKKIKNKISKHRNLGKTETKQFYYEHFKMCHNCKILCQTTFTKQCRKKVKQEKCPENEELNQDDSLYTEKQHKQKKLSGQAVIECEKCYCLFCIKNQFNGKLFNDKGWCPACLDICHCNTCLRSKMIQKLMDLYIFAGGEPSLIKSEKQIIENMRVSRSERCHSEHSSQIQAQSWDFSDSEDKIYQEVIKKEIMKRHSPAEVQNSLRQQQELISMLLDQQNIKSAILINEKALFRQKIKIANSYLDFEHIDRQMAKEMEENEKQRQIEQEHVREQIMKRRREKRDLSKSLERRKCRKIIREEDIYYDYLRLDISSSQEESSSFHIKTGKSKGERKKQKESKYEPQYTF